MPMVAGLSNYANVQRQKRILRACRSIRAAPSHNKWWHEPHKYDPERSGAEEPQSPEHCRRPNDSPYGSPRDEEQQLLRKERDTIALLRARHTKPQPAAASDTGTECGTETSGTETETSGTETASSATSVQQLRDLVDRASKVFSATYARPATASLESCDVDLSQLTVKQLRRRLSALDVSTVGFSEKSDLVAALQAAQQPPCPSTSSAANQSSTHTGDPVTAANQSSTAAGDPVSAPMSTAAGDSVNQPAEVQALEAELEMLTEVKDYMAEELESLREEWDEEVDLLETVLEDTSVQLQYVTAQRDTITAERDYFRSLASQSNSSQGAAGVHAAPAESAPGAAKPCEDPEASLSDTSLEENGTTSCDQFEDSMGRLGSCAAMLAETSLLLDCADEQSCQRDHLLLTAQADKEGALVQMRELQTELKVAAREKAQLQHQMQQMVLAAESAITDAKLKHMMQTMQAQYETALHAEQQRSKQLEREARKYKARFAALEQGLAHEQAQHQKQQEVLRGLVAKRVTEHSAALDVEQCKAEQREAALLTKLRLAQTDHDKMVHVLAAERAVRCAIESLVDRQQTVINNTERQTAVNNSVEQTTAEQL